MGLFSGTTKTTSDSKADTGPSAFQRPYLDQTFGRAQELFNQQSNTPAYQGERYSGMTDADRATLERLKQFASGTGLSTASSISDIGAGLAGNASKATSLLDRYTSMAGEDAATANLAAAQKYASNPQIDALIDANTRDVRRTLTEEMLPGIDRAASATGNINSSRAGVAAGIARRGAEDRISDVSASIRSDQWNRALAMAAQDRAAQMQALGSAADSYAGLTSTGVNAMSQGVQAGYGAFDRITQAGALEQADRQGRLDADYQKWSDEDTRKWDILDRYNRIVGSNQWGQSATESSKGTQKSSGSILGQIMGAVSTAAGAYTAAGSDVRLKKDIKRIGELHDGLGVYTWTYKWEPKGIRHTGVMAHEVERLRPWALGPKVVGFKTVNYDRL